MNVKSKVLSAGVLFFLGGVMALGQTAPARDTIPSKTQDVGEVIIVGYSAVKRQDYTGAVGTVSTQEIDKKAAATNVAQALTGEVAGVRVITTSGQPGAEPTIRVRGFGSVNGNRSPLYVVDGAPFYGNIASLNQEDIESFNVLKDATATAIYGSRGANGVVLITTKKGRANRDMITLESKIGFNSALIPRHEVIRNPEQYIGLSWEALYNRALFSGSSNPVAVANSQLFSNSGIRPKYNMWNATAAQLIDPATHMVRSGITRKYDPEDWRDYGFQTSMRTEDNLSISGGSGKTTYYSGIGYVKDEGYSLNTKFERYSGRLNVAHQAKPWLRGEFNLGYAFTKTRANGQSEDSGSVFWFVDNIPSIYPLYLRNAQGGYVADPYYGGRQFDYGEGRGFGALTNSIADAMYNRDDRERHEMNANFFLSATIVKGLTAETRLGGQYYNNSRNLFTNPYYGSAASQRGSLYKARTELFTYNWSQLIRYMNRFGNHGLQAFVAHETTSWKRPFLEVSKNGLVDPNIGEFNNAINQNPAYSYNENYNLESVFGQVMYDYDNRYLLQGSVRRDGTSRFLYDKWDTFYSVGAGWVIKQEAFLRDVDAVSRLKLRASYGTVGDQAGVGFYSGYNVYNAGNFMGLPGAVFDRLGYPDLTWEKKNVFDAGLEFGFFRGGRISGQVDIYHQTTNNLIFDNRLAPSTGNAIYRVNGGQLVNKGLEFSLTGKVFDSSDFYLHLNVNGEMTKNVLESLPIDFATGKNKIIDLSESGFGRAAGYSLYDFYMREWAGVNPNNGAGQWVVNYVDNNNDGLFTAGEQITSLYEYQQQNPNAVIREGVTENYAFATQKFVGKSAIPDVRGAFGLSTGYKALTLDVQFLYGLGGYAYDYQYASLMHNGQVGSNNWHVDILNRWQKPGDITDVPRLTSNRTGDTNYNSLSTRFLTKADFLVLNNIRIGYNLPRNFVEQLGLNALSLSITGDNLWLSSKRKGFNPTTSETGNSSTYRYSPLSTFTFGAKLTF